MSESTFGGLDAPDPIAPTDRELYTYYFTFGADHLGGRGSNRYVAIQAQDSESARTLMFARYGREWSFQYGPDREEWAATVLPHLIEIDYMTGEDKLTLDLLRDAMHSAEGGESLGLRWIANYRRWREIRGLS